MDREGTVWLLTRQKVFRVGQSQVRTPVAAAVVLKSVTVDGKQSSALADLRVPGGARTILFDVAAADLTTPSHRRFRYRITGLADAWVDLGDHRQIGLTRLPPGSYQLQVQTDDELGRWVNPGVILDFRVAPHFYQTWWFRTSIALLILLVAWAYIRWRLSIATAAARQSYEIRLAERTRIARDLHDTFLQGFQASALQLYNVGARLVAGSAERQALENVLGHMDRITKEGRRRVQALRETDKPFELEQEIRALAEALFQRSLEWKIEIHGAPQILTTDVADELLLIVREALINVTRHAHATRVMIAIRYRHGRVAVDIVDDGIGLEAAKRAEPERDDRFGLTGIRERADEIGARIQIGPGRASIGKTPGVRVHVDVPSMDRGERHLTVRTRMIQLLRIGLRLRKAEDANVK
jgi:signal transduction histidine kinase